MSAASMLGRVAKMEGGRHGVVVVWKHSDETEDSAIARWMAEHPDRPDPHGAALTNLGFCRPGAVVSELHMSGYVQWTFRRLAALRGLTYGGLVGEVVGKSHSWQHDNRWRLDIAKLDAMLELPEFRPG